MPHKAGGGGGEMLVKFRLQLPLLGFYNSHHIKIAFTLVSLGVSIMQDLIQESPCLCRPDINVQCFMILLHIKY